MEEKECCFGRKLERLCYNRNWDDVLLDGNDEEIYNDCVTYNKKIAEEILKIYKYGDIIWIPDPVHYILPKFLREKVNDMKIHVSFMLPFPTSDKFSCFSHPNDFIDNILQASSIDFQYKNDLTNFVNFVKLITNASYKNKVIFHEREVNLMVNSLPIKNYLPNKILSDQSTQNYISKTKKELNGKKLVVSVSKLDSQNLINIYKGIEFYLTNFDKNILFVNLELPLGKYEVEEKAEISRMEDYLKFCGYECNFKRKCVLDYKYYAYLSQADALILMDDFILPLCDFHFINRSKPVLLSKNVRFNTKNKFISVNEKNERKFAEKLKIALTITQEEINNSHENFKETINNSSAEFINKIKKGVKKKLTFEKKIPESDLKLIQEKYKSSKKRIFVLDYDGTLTKIVDSPEKAAPSEKVSNFLKKLSNDNRVIIATGRDKETVDKWFSKEIEVFAEHGVLHRKNGDWTSLVELPGWKEEAKELVNYFVERTPNSQLEIKETSLCFHYRQSDLTIQERQKNLLRKALTLVFKDYKELEVKEGKCVLEIKPSGKNKGDVISLVKDDYEFVFCAGDDVTDEDMFLEGMLKDSFYSVLVGERESYAKFKVKDCDELISFVEKMVE